MASFSAFSKVETLSKSIEFWNSRSLFLVSRVFSLALIVLTSILENSRATSSFVVASPVFAFDFPLPTAGLLGLLSVDIPGRGEKGGSVGSRDVDGSRLD